MYATSASFGSALGIASGGTGATTAAAARTSLGATTVGGNVFTLTNPSAITFLRFNADNTVSALDAATFRTAIGAGTVTSVAGTGTVSGLTLSGTVTTTGSLTLGGTLAVTAANFSSQTANTFLAAPNGAAGVPTFRSIVAADIPTLNQNTTGTATNVTGTVAIANGGTGATTAGAALTALGAAASGSNADITALTNAAGIQVGAPTLGARGSGTLNATGLFINGVPVGTGSGSVSSVAMTVPTFLSVTGSPITTSGTLAVSLSGTALPVANGGTGATTLTGYVKGSGTLALTASATIPTSDLSGTINLASQVTGTLPVANGGTGASSFTAGYHLKGNGTSAVTSSIIYDDGTNVGIGLASPGQKLTVSGTNVLGTIASQTQNLDTGGSSVAQNVVYHGAGASLTLQAGSGYTALIGSTAVPLLFSTNSTERMRISATGDVGIGTSSPSSKLDVNGKVTLTGGEDNQLQWTNNSQTWRLNNSTGGQIYLYNVTGARFPFKVDAATASDTLCLTSAGVGIGTNTPQGLMHVVAGANNSLLLRGPVNLGTGGSIYAVNSTNSAVTPMEFGASVYSFAGGNVGIGTTSPGALLQLNKASGAADLRFSVGGTLYANMYASSSDVNIYSVTATPLIFGTNNTERMRLDSAGVLIVGGTGSEGPSKITCVSTVSGTACTSHRNSAGAGAYLDLYLNATGAAVIGSITNNGNTGVLYNVTSDARLKENVSDADDAASLIDALQVRKFDWRADNSHQRYGFIAQELLEVAPEAVSQPTDPDDMMGVDYSKLVPMLIKEVQSLRARVAQLEGK